MAEAVSPPPDGGYAGGNTAEGEKALLSLTTGAYNTAVGYLSLASNVDGSNNTAIGAGALLANQGGDPVLGGGSNNTVTGTGALLTSTTGSGNTANGSFALFDNGAGCGNSAFGFHALYHTGGTDCRFDGSSNTAVGSQALENSTLGNYNTALGASAGSGVTSASHVICIGAAGADVDNSCYIGNIFGVTSSGGVAAFVNSSGRLGTTTSSKRFKEAIKPMDHSSETLFSLKPVTFRYKKGVDPEATEAKTEFGLVAEDVEKVSPDLIVRDKEGKAYSVRYDQVNAMLLNEFLKEHHTVQELKSMVQKQATTISQQQQSFESKLADQEKRIEALTSEFQKVAAGVEAR